MRGSQNSHYVQFFFSQKLLITKFHRESLSSFVCMGKINRNNRQKGRKGGVGGDRSVSTIASFTLSNDTKLC